MRWFTSNPLPPPEGSAPLVEVEEVVGRATVLATFPLSSPKGRIEGGIAGVRVDKPSSSPAAESQQQQAADGGQSGGAFSGLTKDAAFFRVIREGQVRCKRARSSPWS